MSFQVHADQETNVSNNCNNKIVLSEVCILLLVRCSGYLRRAALSTAQVVTGLDGGQISSSPRPSPRPGRGPTSPSPRLRWSLGSRRHLTSSYRLLYSHSHTKIITSIYLNEQSQSQQFLVLFTQREYLKRAVFQQVPLLFCLSSFSFSMTFALVEVEVHTVVYVGMYLLGSTERLTNNKQTENKRRL